MDIFKEVPKGFHEQFLDTLAQLETKEAAKHKRFSGKRLVLLIAAIVAALGTLTAGAAGIFKWHQAAKERLGISEEVADKLVMEGIAKEEHAIVEKASIKIEAVMSVGTDRGFYLLFKVSGQDGLVLTENSMFEQVSVLSEKEFAGVTCGMVAEELADNSTLYAVELMRRDDMDYAGEAVEIQFINFVEMDKVDITEVLVENTWEMPITLPNTQESVMYAQSGIFTADFHELNITGVEISSSVIRLHGEDWRELYHVTNKQSIAPPVIRYKDGALLQPQAGVGQTGYNVESDSQAGYIEFRLDVTMDVDKVEALLFEDCEIILGECIKAYEGAFEEPDNFAEVFGTETPETMEVVYEYNTNHLVVCNKQKIYLWDTVCNHAEEMVDLEDLGYDAENGGEITVEPGQLLRILPYSDFDKEYIVRLGYGLEAEKRVIERTRK